MGILRKGGIVEMFTDKFSIYRNETFDDEYGGTIEKEILIAENLNCKLSQKSIGPVTGDNINSSTQEFKLFVPSGIIVEQNDKVEVIREGFKYTARASQPFKYGFHQEIILKEMMENGN